MLLEHSSKLINTPRLLCTGLMTTALNRAVKRNDP